MDCMFLTLQIENLNINEELNSIVDQTSYITERKENKESEQQEEKEIKV